VQFSASDMIFAQIKSCEYRTQKVVGSFLKLAAPSNNLSLLTTSCKEAKKVNISETTLYKNWTSCVNRMLCHIMAVYTNLMLFKYD